MLKFVSDSPECTHGLNTQKMIIHSLYFQLCHQNVANVAKKLLKWWKENRSDRFRLGTLLKCITCPSSNQIA